MLLGSRHMLIHFFYISNQYKWPLKFHIRIGALETNARSRVERTFRVFPYTRSSTTIFEMADLEPLQKMMIDCEMTEEDLAECRKVQYNHPYFAPENPRISIKFIPSASRLPSL